MNEINALCRELAEPWAWEYLWKEWYQPRRWTYWARAVSKDFYPIINSNATVESLWKTLKHNYLRKHPRASLERLGDILMNDFLIKRVRQISALRSHHAEATWYREFRTTWGKAVDQIEVADRAYEGELEEDSAFLLIKDRDMYGTNIHAWWCRCPAFRTSAYHICKHLIRVYCDTPQRQRNARPNFGSVWRQPAPPLLWIKGLHSEDRRRVYPLKTAASMSERRRDIDLDDEDVRLEPTMLDSDVDEDEDEAEGSESDLRSQLDSDEEDTGIMDETVHVAIEVVQQGEEKLEAIAEMKEQLLAQVRFLEELGKCRPDDAHLEELPPVGINHIRAWETARKRYQGLLRVRTMPTTFGGLRTGNVFAPF